MSIVILGAAIIVVFLASAGLIVLLEWGRR